jgi:hypothetical protein
VSVAFYDQGGVSVQSLSNRTPLLLHFSTRLNSSQSVPLLCTPPFLYILFTMTVRAKKFTPEVLLSAPRRSPATPNPAGTLALFTVSTYSFQFHSKTSEIRVLDIKTGQSKLLSSDGAASEPTWLLENDLVLWLKSGDKGKTNLVIADAGNFENTYELRPDRSRSKD